MRQLHKLTAVAAVSAVAALGLAACGGSSPSKTATTPSGTPVKGGVLHVVAAAGPDHIDTVPAYYTADYMLEHAYTRQLVSYPSQQALSTSSSAWKTDVTPVADVATTVPTTANGGITSGGKVYTFHIKSGVDWNTTPPRQVTSADFLREFKAFCNPVSPVGNPDYYESTISGLASYCSAEAAFFAKKSNAPTAANIAKFQNTHTISGISTPNSMTIKFTLMKPFSDFIYMLAMPFASARPVEYDSYVPNSLQLDQHTVSDGPYQISSYIPNKSITLVKNPAWRQSTDSLRHQYLNSIVVTEGVTSAATQLADMEAGTQNVPMDTPINPPSIPNLISTHVPNFKVWAWSDTFPYIVFNLRSPDAGGAMGKLLVRQAIEYGVDKIAAGRVYGGTAVTKVINTVIPPGNSGYVNYNLYPDSNGLGNTAKCKADLTKAGYPHGVTLLYTYPSDTVNTDEFSAIQASLRPCGVTLKGKPEPGSSFFTDLGDAPVNNKAGAWDMGQPGWIPDWFGNNGRTVIQALFAAPCAINTVNYGCYHSTTVDSLITKAETASSLTAAGSYWHQADEDIMKDAAIVPLGDQGFPLYVSKLVRPVGGLFSPTIGDIDLTNTWLAKS